MLKRTRSFLVLVMLLMTVTMSAQVTTATMSGKVTAQDEPIIGATIVAIHEPSGTRYGTVTNVSGQFNLQGMRTGGPYKVEISYVGYQTAIYKGINLLLGENYVLNVSLKESSELLDEVVPSYIGVEPVYVDRYNLQKVWQKSYKEPLPEEIKQALNWTFLNEI